MSSEAKHDSECEYIAVAPWAVRLGDEYEIDPGDWRAVDQNSRIFLGTSYRRKIKSGSIIDALRPKPAGSDATQGTHGDDPTDNIRPRYVTPGLEHAKRLVGQIAVSGDRAIALCDDGTIWAYDVVLQQRTWHQLPPVPGSQADK